MSTTTDWISALATVGAAVGTVAAVITSLWLARRQGREIREREDRQQAEQLTAWFVPYEGEQDNPTKLYIGLRIKNASNQLVYDVVAQTVGVQGSFRKTAVGDTDEKNRYYGALIGNVPPGEITTRIDNSGGGMHRRFWVELAFQDAAGRYWIRHGNGVLKRVDKHPIDLYNIGRPVGWEN